MQGGASARAAAYWVVREERTRSDNAADDHSWTGSYGWPHTRVPISSINSIVGCP
jgi:hypothetical protein